MQPKFIATDVFLRFEREWQHMRHAERHLEIEAVRANDRRSDSTTGPDSAAPTQSSQKS
ncbi:hypothetical protein PYH37_000232 [Sinorhizobium numidicum]|uniref:Uncharacterized protein n=1 Tax=Sinorhizobium numidicum TaxID=680248 RepID=A0ABY8CQJ1_9HYPH|nr:hypothetical protein [Sinorhizobium numidicum]WEX74922.1 hypothetical protein PYH37_000232 [Sinorhizobium numidicum]WEX80915.1 hypothetical protein PYH38_000234 [Sinorhizobium numidicum]